MQKTEEKKGKISSPTHSEYEHFDVHAHGFLKNTSNDYMQVIFKGEEHVVQAGEIKPMAGALIQHFKKHEAKNLVAQRKHPLNDSQLIAYTDEEYRDVMEEEAMKAAEKKIAEKEAVKKAAPKKKSK